MSETPLLDSGHKATIASVKAETPAQFTFGGHWDGRKVTGGITVNRSWRNGLGLTAYARAWWNDSAVLPQDKSGAVVGVEGTYRFKEK